MTKAVLLLLLSIGSGTPGVEVPATVPSAFAVTSPATRPDLALGAWYGTLVDVGGARHSIEASFTDGGRAATVFGYFTLLGDRRESMTVRRLGRVVGDDLVFDLREGGRVALRLVSGRLVGEVVDPTGHLLSGHSVIELARFRP